MRLDMANRAAALRNLTRGEFDVLVVGGGAYVGTGVLLYDTIGGARALPRHRHLSQRRALELAPSLKPAALTGAIRYFGAVEDYRRRVDAELAAEAVPDDAAASTRASR